MEAVLVALLTIAGLTTALASLLVLGHRWLAVEEDPRLDRLEALLPGTNCGGCGQPGCRAFAEVLLAGDAEPAGCTVSTSEQRQRVADFLGVAVGESVRRVARLACAGGDNVARHRAHYVGISSCAAAAVLAGGGKGCFWGCLGEGDCVRACTFDALEMDRHRLPVVDPDKCTACGDCVRACPKDLFSLEPVDQPLWVACRSLEAGDDVLEECQVGCTGCGRCAADAPGHIRMQHSLPVIDRSVAMAPRRAIDRCPTGAIVWWGGGSQAERGALAVVIARQSPRPDAPT